MKRLTLSLLPALAVAALLGQTSEVSNASGSVTVYTPFDHPPSSTSVEYMKAELDAIMAIAGLQFDWRSLKQASGHEALSQIVVVNFRGTCGADGPPLQELPPGARGWTHVLDGTVLPFSDVDCDRIRQMTSTVLAGAPPFERTRLPGRVMARVLAHEMYHFFTGGTGHASLGHRQSFLYDNGTVYGTPGFRGKADIRGASEQAARFPQRGAPLAGSCRRWLNISPLRRSRLAATLTALIERVYGTPAQSILKTAIGSVLTARTAGATAATGAVTSIVSTALARTLGSVGFTP
jgi:hypothetical protein